MNLLRGDRVRIDIPNKLDPDFRFHGAHGVVIDISEVWSIRTQRVEVVLDEYPVTMEVFPWEIRPPFHNEGV